MKQITTLIIIFCLVQVANAQVFPCQNDSKWGLCNDKENIVSFVYDTILKINFESNDSEETNPSVVFLGYKGGEIKYVKEEKELWTLDLETFMDVSYLDTVYTPYFNGGKVDVLNSTGLIIQKELTGFSFDINTNYHASPGWFKYSDWYRKKLIYNLFEKPQISDKFSDFISGHQKAFIISKGLKQGLISRKGKEILPKEYDEICEIFLSSNKNVFFTLANNKVQWYNSVGARITPNIKNPEAEDYLSLMNVSNISAASWMVKNGADINANDQWNTALSLAVERGDVKLTDFLLSNNANAFLETLYGYSERPFISALNNSDIECINLFFKYNKDVSSFTVEYDHKNTFDLACSIGNLEVIEALIDRKVDSKGKKYCSEFPVHESLKFKNPEIIKLLLKKGFDINEKDKSGKTPLDYAIEGEDKGIIKVLKK